MPAEVLPNIAVLSAATTDSRSVQVDYSIEDAARARSFELGIYRSTDAGFGPDVRPVGSMFVSPPTYGSPTLDDSGQPATSEGTHRLTVPLPDGLPPDPARPFVLAVADPSNSIPETTKADNTASFRTHVIGVVVHGGIQGSKKDPPKWEIRLARALRDRVGYDAVIPYNWAAESNTAGAAAKQGPRVANIVRKVSSEFPTNEPVDLHLIGHSEGAVVVSQALRSLEHRSTPQLRAGFVKVTLLDPHAASNAPVPQLSVSSGLDGWIADHVIRSYQGMAKDPPVVVPGFVQDAEVYYQRTPISMASAGEGAYNLWGQVPVRGQAQYSEVTGPGVTHSGETGVQVWYYHNVVPTLRDGGTFVNPTQLTATRVPSGEVVGARDVVITGTPSPTYTGTAAAGANIRLLARHPCATPTRLLGRTMADARGDWTITTRPLIAGSYRILARTIVPEGMPRPRSPIVHTIPADLLVVKPSGPRGP